MKKLTFLILTCIVIFGAFLRFYNLGGSPAGFHRDEAFLAYNGWSILKTGSDISGNFLPLHLANYLYSPAGYSYASIPFLSIFGLTPFAGRAASAFFGTATIFLVFFLVRKLFPKAPMLALLAPLILAISPWHINLSRTATESTIVAFFVTLGVFLYPAIFSYLSFGITIFIYQAPRAFLPLFIPVLYLLHNWWHKNLIKHIALFTGIIVLPVFIILSSPNLSLRLSTLSIFGNQQTQLITDEQIREDGISQVPLLFTRALHNKIVGHSQQFLQNYFAHFSYPFLFTDQGLPIRYKIPSSGLLYLVELPLIFLGIWFLIKKETKNSLLLFSWILLVPVGSALTFDDVPNLQRTLLVQPALAIIIAYGIYQLLQLRKYALPIIIGLSFIYVAQLFYYLEAYHVHQAVHQPYYRNEGSKELVQKINELLPSYKKAVITNRETAPSIFFLYFSNYDPKLFQQETKNTTMKDYDRINFGKYEFTTEECPVRETVGGKITGEKGVLYVNFATCKTPVEAIEMAKILRRDNTVVFNIVELK